MRRTPALIIGGGPAGAAAAITLARAGAPHLLVERTRETGDALCGGFLSWRTLETLDALGIPAEQLSPRAITRVRLFAGDRVAETRLPRPGLAVSRLRLDTLLLATATAAGAAIERGVTVRSVEGTRAAIDGDTLDASVLLLASGKHEIRGARRPASARDPTLGLRLRLPPSAALERLVGDAVELHVFDRGYAGIALQEDGSSNVCLAVRRSRLQEAGSPAALMQAIGQHHLGDRLAGMTAEMTIDAVANVPYGWRARATAPGVYRLGDQAGVIPSLAGEGMGIALASGVSAARAHLVGEAAQAWQQGFSRRLMRPIAIADAIRHLAERPGIGALAPGLTRTVPVLIRMLARATRISASGA